MNPFSRGLTTLGNLETVCGKFNLLDWFLPTNSVQLTRKCKSVNVLKTDNKYSHDVGEETGAFFA